MPLLAVDLRFDWLDSDTTGLGIDDFEISGDLVLDGNRGRVASSCDCLLEIRSAAGRSPTVV